MCQFPSLHVLNVCGINSIMLLFQMYKETHFVYLQLIIEQRNLKSLFFTSDTLRPWINLKLKDDKTLTRCDYQFII